MDKDVAEVIEYLKNTPGIHARWTATLTNYANGKGATNAILTNELVKLYANFDRVYASFIAAGIDVREAVKNEGHAALDKMHDAICRRIAFDERNAQ